MICMSNGTVCMSNGIFCISNGIVCMTTLMTANTSKDSVVITRAEPPACGSGKCRASKNPENDLS